MKKVTEQALRFGFTHAAALDPAVLECKGEVRQMCRDGCHQYGKRWSCPPACGTLEQCQAQMHRYKRGILLQTTGDMEDDFDVEALYETEQRHKASFTTLVRQIRTLYPNCLPLTAGTCTLCRKCTYPERPCRFPKKRFSSMEAYGLLVSDVCLKSGLKYYYGPKTITYTSCILTD